jgi:hypothetical protein
VPPTIKSAPAATAKLDAAPVKVVELAKPAIPTTAEASSKSDTSRVPLEVAQPAVAAKPIIIGGPADAESSKSDTSRVPLEEARPGPVTGGAGGSPSTISLKKPSELGQKGAAKVSDDATTGEARTIVKKSKSPSEAQPRLAGGPATIRLKKPSSGGTVTPQPVPVRDGGGAVSDKTQRVDLGGIPEESTQRSPRTVRIKRPGDTSGEAAPGGARTVKIRRADGSDVSAASTQRKTIGIKRPESMQVTDRSVRFAQEEEDLLRKQGKIEGEEKQERLIWVWCLVAVAASIIMTMTIWMFSTQLFPKEENLSWWGRELPFNHPYYENERDWF